MNRLIRKAPIYAAAKEVIAYKNTDGNVSLYRFGNIIVLEIVTPIITPILGPTAYFDARFNSV